MEETRETAFEPCPYCGASAASYQDGVVDVLHGDDCPQGDCEPFRMSLIRIADGEKWNKWAKQVRESSNA